MTHPSDEEVQQVAARLRDHVSRVPFEVLAAQFDDTGYLMLLRFEFNAANQLAARLDQHPAPQPLPPALIEQLLQGGLVFDRQTAATILAADPNVMGSLDASDPHKVALCVSVACPGEPEADMMAWTWLQVRETRTASLEEHLEAVLGTLGKQVVLAEFARRVARIPDPSARDMLRADQCHKCGKPAGEAVFQVCSACKFIGYDCKDCQRADWPFHKRFCRGYKLLRERLELQLKTEQAGGEGEEGEEGGATGAEAGGEEQAAGSGGEAAAGNGNSKG